MNKTIIININGTVFHIEEDAYEILKSYMMEVKRHFMDSADSLEITTDIENRIAEMFNEILSKDTEGSGYRQVIVEADVKLVINQMGDVADFEHPDEEHQASGEPHYSKRIAKRRLFRNPDDHLVAGVCAGIANYFDIDVVWIRLAFAFGSILGGSGLILYAILWLVVPKAITRADRMAMKGEKQDLKGFKRNLEEELNAMKNNFSEFGVEAKPFVYKARDFVGDLTQHLLAFIALLGSLLIKLLGAFIILCCFGFMVFLLIAFVTVIGFGNMSIFPGTPFNLVHSHNLTPLGISALIVGMIPLITIVLITLKGIFKTGSVNFITGTSALIIWVMSLASLIYFVLSIAQNYKVVASYSKTIALLPTKNNTYYLKLNDLKYFTARDSARLNLKNIFKNENISLKDIDENRELHNVFLDVEKSDINAPVLVENYKARGKNYENALFNVRNNIYIYSQKDTTLTFDYKLTNTHDEEWHDESVLLTLKLPLNAKVVVDRDIEKIMNAADVYGCNVNNKRDGNKLKTATFIMTDNGLQCKIDTPIAIKVNIVVK